jgi:hypothetical protein
MTSTAIAPAVAAPEPDDKVPHGLERRENVVTAGAAVAVSFPHRRAVVGVGPGLGYERALSRVVAIEVGGALAVASRNRTVGGGAGISVPLYLIGDAPSGFFLAPGLAVAISRYETGFGGGLSIGYQHVFGSGLALGVSAGATLTYRDLSYYGTFGFGVGAAAGYAF